MNQTDTSTGALMADSTLNRWKDLVYSLVYPGILGSMIFDIVDPLRDPNLVRLSLGMIVGIFVIDYWHMKNNLRRFHSSYPLVVCDLLIAGCFAASYYALTKITGKDFPAAGIPNNCRAGLLWLLAAFIFIIAAKSSTTIGS
jgi:hypothetical protein